MKLKFHSTPEKYYYYKTHRSSSFDVEFSRAAFSNLFFFLKKLLSFLREYIHIRVGAHCRIVMPGLGIKGQ